MERDKGARSKTGSAKRLLFRSGRKLKEQGKEDGKSSQEKVKSIETAGGPAEREGEWMDRVGDTKDRGNWER